LLAGVTDRVHCWSQEAEIQLLDLPVDVLRGVVTKLDAKEQLPLHHVCRQTRVLVAGAVMTSRVACAIFSLPGCRMRSLVHPILLGPRQVGVWDRHAFDTGFGVVRRYAGIRCEGFAHSSRLIVKVDVLHEHVGVQQAKKREGMRVWEEDWMRMGFGLSAEGDVSGLLVVFRSGFAEGRAEIVGRILYEATKHVDPTKAELLTQAFAWCEDLGGGGVFELGSDGHIVSVEDQEGSSEEPRVRVTTHPPDDAGNIRVEMRFV
jgi:hypothetical protein